MHKNLYSLVFNVFSVQCWFKHTHNEYASKYELLWWPILELNFIILWFGMETYTIHWKKKTEGENERKNFSFTHEIFKVYNREQCSNKLFIATVRSVSHFIFKNSNEKTYTVTQNICYFAAYSLQIRECTQLTILDSSIQKVALTCSVRQYKIHHLIKKDIIKDTYLTYIDTLLDTNLPVFTTPKDNNIIKIIQIVQLCHLLNVLQVQNNNRQVNFPE